MTCTAFWNAICRQRAAAAVFSILWATMGPADDPVAPLRRELYRAQLAAAEASTRLGEYAAAKQWLRETEPSLRGFEWRVQHAQSDESIGEFVVGRGHAAALAISPDGTTLACGLSDGAVELRDLPAGKLRTTIAAHQAGVTSVRFDRTGERIVTASYDRTVKVWQVAGGIATATFAKHGSPVGGAVFLPDGKSVASSSYERLSTGVVGVVHYWCVADGAIMRTVRLGRKPVVALAVSLDGKTMAAASWDFCAFSWPTGGGEPVAFRFPNEGIYNACDGVALSPDGATLAACGKDKTARIWKLADGQLAATLRGHADFVAKLAFAPDGKQLATASADATVRLWKATDGAPLGTLCGHSTGITDVAFSPDGRTIVSASVDGAVKFWNAAYKSYGGVRWNASRAAYVVRFSPDNQRLACCSYDGRVQIWNAASGDSLASWQAHPSDKSCHMLDWSLDGKSIASGSYDQTVKLWHASDGKLLATLRHPVALYYMRFSRDGKRLISCGGQTAFVWNVAERKLLTEFKGHTRPLTSVDFDPEGKRGLSTAADGKAMVWDVATGQLHFAMSNPDAAVAEAAFSPDGKFIAVAGRSGTLNLHGSADGRLLKTLHQHRHGYQHIAFAPDGSRIAFAADVVGIVDARHGGLLGTFRPHLDAPYNLAFNSVGTQLATCSTDKSIAILHAAPLRERALRTIGSAR